MSELLYRERLKESLLDLAGELRTGRDAMTHSSGLYRNLDRSLTDVIRVLEEHEGEEILTDEVRADLENKIRIMKEQARPYRDSKIQQGALANVGMASPAEAERLRVTKKRFLAANDLLKIDSVIPRNPGPEHGIVAAVQLEPGDRPETDWRLKYKQNIRYLAIKQLQTYEKRSSEIHAPAALEQDEFDTLMDLAVKGSVLNYKDDAHLCQKYPKLRMTLDKALTASSKLHGMSDQQVARYLQRWSENALEKALAAAEKEKRRKGQTFTEQDRKNVREKQLIRIEEQMKKFNSANKLCAAGDVLEQQARFADLKMKVIADKRYVEYPHTNTLGRIFGVSDYEGLMRTAETQKEKQFYQNLRDLRELEDAGIRHVRPASTYSGALYRKVDETVHTTVKRDFMSFISKAPEMSGISMNNSKYGAKDGESKNMLSVEENSKFRVGKIGLKLHSKHKRLQLSGGVAFGQVKTSTAIGINLNKVGAEVSLSGEASAVRARIKAQASRFGVGLSGGANVSLGYAYGKLSGGVGSVKVKDTDGKEHTELGVSAEIGGVAAAVKGGGGATLNLFGVKIGISFTGYAGAVGASASLNATVGGVGLSLNGALGLGAGVKISINWSEAAAKLKKLWRSSKLMKLINRHKENKRLREQNAMKEAKRSIGKKPEPEKEGGMKADRKVKDDNALKKGGKPEPEPEDNIQRSLSF